MEQQATNSVKHILDKGTLVLKAIEIRTKGETSTFDEARKLADEIRGAVARGEFVSDEQKIKLAEYILEYHVDYNAIARESFDLLDAAAKKE